MDNKDDANNASSGDEAEGRSVGGAEGEGGVVDSTASGGTVDLQTTEQRLFETKTIRAQNGAYWAELRVEFSWSVGGDKFDFRIIEFRILEGKLSTTCWAVVVQEPRGSAAGWTDNKIFRITEIWQGWNVGAVIPVSTNKARIYFKTRYTPWVGYDRDLEGAIVVDFVPPPPPTPPSIDPIDFVANRTFEVKGRGLVGAVVSVWNTTGTLLGSKPVGNDSVWKVDVVMPATANTLTFNANQKFNEQVSEKSASVTVTLVAPVVITTPKPGDVIREPRPTVVGTGHTNGTIRIYEADNGAVLYGSGTVTDGVWRIALTESLPDRPFVFHAEQTFGKWVTRSNKVPVTVQLKPHTPVITQPGPNSEQNRSFTVRGTQGEVGAVMRILLNLEQEVVGTLQRVTSDAWDVSVVIPDRVPPGEVRLDAQQTLGVPSDRSDYLAFKLKPPQPAKLTVQIDAQGEVTVGGVGHIGATFYLHVVGNPTPFHTFRVTTSPWTVPFSDWLPGTLLVNGRQSVPDGAGQPIYSDWIPEDATIVVPVPLPTLTSRVSPEGIPTFSGAGKNWSGQPASRVEVRLHNASSAIVPIVDVRTDTTWSSTATARWAPGTYLATAALWFNTVQSEWVQPPVSVVISVPLAVIEKVTPNGRFAQVVGRCWLGAVVTIEFSDSSATHPVADTDKNGEWDFQRSTAFRPGRHTVTVTQTFGGQTSNPVSMPFEIEVSMPVITPPPGGQTDHFPVLHGIGGIDGFKISVLDYVTHELLGETHATGDGWSVPLKELDYLTHTIFAIQELGDLRSLPSNSVAFKVVLYAPRIDLPKTRTAVPRTFTVEGYARAGKGFDRTEVEVYIDDVPHRVYPNFGDGYFKQHFTRAVGPCVLKARQYFKDQESPPSEDVLMTIVPDKALIETPGIDEAVGRIAVICGFGYWGDEVVVALPNGTELGRAEVQADGTWYCPIETPEAGINFSLLTEQRKGEFHSGWSEARPVQRLASPPTFDEPPEGNWEGETPGFAGDAMADSRVDVVAWYDPDKKHAKALVPNGGRWAGVPERNLPAGPQWARAVQVAGGKRSMPADSKRFEVAPPEEPPHLA